MKKEAKDGLTFLYLLATLATMNDGGNNNDGDSQSAGLSPEMGEELLLYCKSDSLSVTGLHEIFERNGWTPNNTHHISNNFGIFLPACRNERVNEGIIQCLLKYFPGAASAVVGDKGNVALHYACGNKNVTLCIIQCLIDAAPDSVRSEDNYGYMPLHYLCYNREVGETAAVQILKFLLEKHPEAVRLADNDGDLPIHLAARTKSPEFCRLLIDAYPGSEQMPSADGTLPLHIACADNTVDTAKYFYQRYPDALHHATTEGHYPIHYTIDNMRDRHNPASAVAIVQFLLGCDPNIKLKQCQRRSLLHYACDEEYNETNVEAGIQMIETIFDAHPEAIEDNRITANIQRFHQQVQEFINGELVYARQAKAHRLMNTPDANGQLPLHGALQSNVRLGSIKLLVKGNPTAIRTADFNLAMPLHIACEYHNSAAVVQYLVDLDRRTLRAVDIDHYTALHYACRGAKHDSIALLLLEKYAASVSKRNTHGKLPIDLLWESKEVSDRESVEYIGSVFQLVRAYPEMIAISNLTRIQAVDVDATRYEKKRKLCRSDEVRHGTACLE